MAKVYRRRDGRPKAILATVLVTNERHERTCNLCPRVFRTRTRFDRFCDGCKRNNYLYQSYGYERDVAIVSQPTPKKRGSDDQF